jgi:hypothetical protein
MRVSQEMQPIESPLAMARRIAGQARTREASLRAELAYNRTLIKHQPAWRDDEDVARRCIEPLKHDAREAIRTRKRWERFVALLEAQGDAD